MRAEREERGGEDQRRAAGPPPSPPPSIHGQGHFTSLGFPPLGASTSPAGQAATCRISPRSSFQSTKSEWKNDVCHAGRAGSPLARSRTHLRQALVPSTEHRPPQQGLQKVAVPSFCWSHPKTAAESRAQGEGRTGRTIGRPPRRAPRRAPSCARLAGGARTAGALPINRDTNALITPP